MKSPQKNFGVVVWDDAVGGLEGKEHEIQFGPERCYTYGWFIRSDASGALIAADWVETNNSFRDVTFIPRGMIVEEQLLTLAKKRKGKAAAVSVAPAAAISASEESDVLPA